MSAISVNGIEIAEAAVAAEMQHHPASSREASHRSAAQALAVRALLLARANTLGLVPVPQTGADGKSETDEEALLRQLVEHEVKVPEPDEESCIRYYRNNPDRFKSPDIFEASHILFSAPASDAQTFNQAILQAEAAIGALKRDPSIFEELARKHSSCPSGVQGGNLGQIVRGQTTPEFETFLLALEEGQLCPVPVKTRYGVHVLKLHRRMRGSLLPFEAVKDRIAAFLSESVWRSAIAQYIGLLAAGANVRGLDLPAAK
jgi:peptidyl-prolyl cis-trans isomerase C